MELKQIETKLDNAIEILRSRMDTGEYKDYILGLLCLKYICEKQHAFSNNHNECIEQFGYYIPDDYLISNIILDNFNILTRLESLKQIISDGSNSDVPLFDGLNLNSPKLGKTEQERSELISRLLNVIDSITLDFSNSDIDLLGNAYEYLISKFALESRGNAGEFYTPQSVSRILAKIVTVGKEHLNSIYDPTCGSGSLLIGVAKEVKKVGSFYGQELNRTTYNLARMNMILHDIHYSKFDIKQGDTLEEDLHKNLKFDAIVANPPYSAQWSADPKHLKDNRFSQYGKLAPKTKADFAFVQHMVHHLSDSGIIACVLPHGVLFRGAAEGHIRKYLIEDRNYIDAVIGLPANIFFGTSIPTCILVLKNCRETNNDVLFIDASNNFEKQKNQNILLPEHIEKIINTYRERIEEDKFSHRATLEEIKENDYNLNIPRYVNTFEEEEQIDLDEIANKIKALDNEMAETDATILKFCKELNIKTPF